MGGGKEEVKFKVSMGNRRFLKETTKLLGRKGKIFPIRKSPFSTF